jgi:hypothetical protein
MVTLEDSTFSEKHFLSSLTESAAASTASVRTGTDDGVLLFDSSLTLVNAQGAGTTFTFGYTHDTEPPFRGSNPFNDHKSLEALRSDVVALIEVVQEWGHATLGALYDFADAAEEG